MGRTDLPAWGDSEEMPAGERVTGSPSGAQQQVLPAGGTRAGQGALPPSRRILPWHPEPHKVPRGPVLRWAPHQYAPVHPAVSFCVAVEPQVCGLARCVRD